ncbi:MAG: DoxX-like family protein [Cellvibrionaceae bacterium]
MSSIQIARYIISFNWLYHGICPKLIHVAPLEQLMTASFGFSDEVSYWITKSAGVSEVIFGILVFVFYQSKAIVLLNIMALIGLLGFVVILQPQLLIEAFNPVTTNIPMIGLSLILLNHISSKKQTTAD